MTVTLSIDHLVISCGRLEEGVAFVEDSLGVTMAPDGQHRDMGTHNRLLGLGGVYLEVIAVDPMAPAPDRPRWFDLDRFAGPPRLTNWVARTVALSSALEVAPPGTGVPMELSRGDLVWDIAISDDGSLPFGGAFPGLIDWGFSIHPTRSIPDSGFRLKSFSVSHPDSRGLIASLSRFRGGLEAYVAEGPEVEMHAVLSSRGRLVELS